MSHSDKGALGKDKFGGVDVIDFSKVERTDDRVANTRDDFDLAPSHGTVKPPREKRSRDDMLLKTKQFKKVFGYDVDTVMEKDFATALLKRTKDKWAFDRSVVSDQLSRKNFGELRQNDLKAIDGNGYLSEQYGLKTARNKNVRDRGGLRMINSKSTDYNRDIPGWTVKTVCEDVYRQKKKLTPKDKLPDGINFINSAAALERYKFFYGEEDLWTTEDLGHGVQAVLPTNKVVRPDRRVSDDPDPCDRFDKRMQHLGGTPSVFEAIKQRAVTGKAPVLPEGGEQPSANDKLLTEVVGKENKALGVLKAVPDGHPMKSMAKAASSLVAGLETALLEKAKTDTFKKDPLVANGLKTLQAIVDALPTLLEDSARFLNAYEAMIDELYLVLASAKPYDGKSFKQAAGKSLSQRAPALNDYAKDVTTGSYLVSSGMDAISTAWQAATKLTGQSGAKPLVGTDTPEYFEVSGLFDGTKPGGSDDIMTAVLNPSTPQTGAGDSDKGWDAGKLVAAVTERLKAKKLVLVLDVTVEKAGEKDGESDLNLVMKELKGPVEDGTLKIVLAKSYQKYPSLGSGKIMAGSISIIAKQDPSGEGAKPTGDAVKFLENTEGDLNWIGNDESQMMTHFLSAAPQSELDLGGRAAENAAFALSTCMPTGGPIKAAKDLPFLLVKSPPDLGPSGEIFQQYMSAMGSDQRDSFGFLSSSHLYVPYAPKEGDENGVPGQRITFGQESPDEVIEKFWAIGHCALDDDIAKKLAKRDPAGAGAVADKASAAIAGAAQKVIGDATLVSFADAALKILTARYGDKPEESKQKALAGLAIAIQGHKKAIEGGKTDPKEKELRDRIDELLKTSEKESKNPIADQLQLIGCAFPVKDRATEEGGSTQSDLQSNPDFMRANKETVWQGPGEPDPAAQFAPNIAASCLKLLDVAYGGNLATLDEDNAKKVAGLYDAVLSTGLEDLSPGARTKVVNGWAKTQTAALAGDDTCAKACGDLARNAERMTYKEDRANLLKNVVPDSAIKAMKQRIEAAEKEVAALEKEIKEKALGEDSEQAMALAKKKEDRQKDQSALDATLQTMFGPLDVEARVVLMKDLILKKDFHKTMACFDRFDADLKRALRGGAEMVKPEQLSGRASGRAPQALSEAEISEVVKQLELVRTSLEQAMLPPPIIPQPIQPPINQPQPVQNPPPVQGGGNVVVNFLQGLVSMLPSWKWG